MPEKWVEGFRTVARVRVYIDGFNLYYGCLKRTPYKWLHLGQLCIRMLPNDEIQHIAYYPARVSARPHNPSAPADQLQVNGKFRGIQRLAFPQILLRGYDSIPGFQVGHLRLRSHRTQITL